MPGNDADDFGASQMRPALPGPDLPAGTVQTYTRADDLRDIIAKLQGHAHDCIDGQEFEAAHAVIVAAESIQAAIGKLEEADTADLPLEPSAQTRAGG
jgi:hypothetical protein